MAAGEVNKRLNIIVTVRDAATAQLTRTQRMIKMLGGTVGQTDSQLAKLNHRFLQVGRALLSFLIIRTVGVQLTNFFKLLLHGNEVLERATTSLARLGGSLGFAKKQIDFIRATAMRAPFDFESILSASRLLVAYGKDLEHYLPVLLDWASAMGVSAGELEGYAAAMGKILAGSPYVMRILTTRGIGMDAWKAALQDVNKELPKSQQYAQALELVLKRFEGQAAVLARTMAGLKTNIHDVWVEITREIGLSMFARIRTALFGMYQQLRDIADNQREKLYQIGDVIGLWTARLIKFVQGLGSMKSALTVIEGILKAIALVISMQMVKGLALAILKFIAMSAAAQATSLAVNAVAVAAGLIALAFVQAKMRAIDLNIYLGDISSGLEVIRDFGERKEKVFTREELAIVRAMDIGIGKTIESLSGLNMAIRTMSGERDEAEKTAKFFDAFFGGLGGISGWMVRLPGKLGLTFGQLSYKTMDEMLKGLQGFVDRGGPIMAQLYGDEAWGARVQTYINALAEMHKAYLTEDILPDPSEFANIIHHIGAELVKLRTVYEPMIALSEKNEAAAKAVQLVYESMETTLTQIDMLMDEWYLNQAGVAGYEHATTRNVKELLGLYMKLTDDLEFRVELQKRLDQLTASERAMTREQKKDSRELTERTMALWKNMKQMAETAFQVGAIDQTQLIQFYTDLSNAVRGFLSSPELTSDDRRSVGAFLTDLISLIAEGGAKLLDFSLKGEMGFRLVLQGVSPLIDAFATITEGAKEMAKALSSAIRQVLKWLIQLVLQMLVVAALMSIFKLASGGGATGLLGALQVIMGAGLNPKKAQHGYRGWVTKPTMFMAGEHGKPEFVNIAPGSGGGRSGGGVINIYGDVNDAEAFIRKVQKANYAIERRTGGGL